MESNNYQLPKYSWSLLSEIYQPASKFLDDAIKSCGNKSAACMLDKNGKYLNIGDINDRITIQADKPVLHYDHGSFHTSIHFKCASIKSVQGIFTVLYPHVISRIFYRLVYTVYLISYFCFWKGSEKEHGFFFILDIENVENIWKFDFISLVSYLVLCKMANLFYY